MLKNQPLSFTGVVSTGKGMSTKSMTKNRTLLYQALGYDPVPGTLNVQTGKHIARQVAELPGGVTVKINDRYTTYHEMKMFDMKVHVLAYRYGIEVVAPIHIRQKFGLVNGDTVTLSARVQP